MVLGSAVLLGRREERSLLLGKEGRSGSIVGEDRKESVVVREGGQLVLWKEI